MSVSRQTSVACDRCDNTMELAIEDYPKATQRAGWQHVEWKDLGASDDSQSLRQRDLCPACTDSFREWL